MRVCHTITINQDENCENNPNEDFFSNLALASGMQPIMVIRERARVIIDDNMEPECSKFYVEVSFMFDHKASGIQPININISTTRVIIDDSGELECSKFDLQCCFMA